MTATPIPRTLAMTAYADLDVSIIDELPPGRTPVKTVVLADARRDEVVVRIRSGLPRRTAGVLGLPADRRIRGDALPGRGGDRRGARGGAAGARASRWCTDACRRAAKERTMRRFKDGEIQLLVATTVIEVGVDVPNATLMVIENAERMGLAQLHQLRGRVGPRSTCELLPAAVSRAAVAAGARAARRHAQHQRRLRGGAPRPRAARTGRTARHAPDGPRANARRRSRCATPICCRECRSPRSRCCAIGPRMWRRSSAAGWDMRSNTAASVRMPPMNPNPRPPSEARNSIRNQWLPAERLGQLDVDARMRPWLIGKGLLTLRMKDACGERFELAPDRAMDGPARAMLTDRALQVAD